MGIGPYSFLYVYEMPTPGDGSAAMFGNSNPYADAPKLKFGLGTCACCGHGITIICVIKDGAGDLWGVGSDCVEKTDSPALANAARVAVAKPHFWRVDSRRAKEREPDRTPRNPGFQPNNAARSTFKPAHRRP